MSKTPSPRRALYLVIESFPVERLPETSGASESENAAEIFVLTEMSAPEALEKIFAADTIAVWAPL